MKVELSESAGFCVGVKKALETCVNVLEKEEHLCMLGDIVHNEFVVGLLKKKGVKKIKKPGKGSGKTLLIRAHGAPLSTYIAAEKAGYKIVDATCPMVKEIHKIARKDEKQGRTIIIVGDKNHDEVLGIKGSLLKTPVVIDPKKNIPYEKLKKVIKASVVVQSTQNIDTVTSLVDRLSKVIKDLRFHDTICVPTKNRQESAHKIPKKHDGVVIIGSKTSANTRRLFEISKEINKNTYWISSAKEIRPSKLKGLKSIGVLAGASTPDEVINETVSLLRSL
jgi:4-hydroxy-3-methylbut-2-en-1-yl diphosphate reductase